MIIVRKQIRYVNTFTYGGFEIQDCYGTLLTNLESRVPPDGMYSYIHIIIFTHTIWMGTGFKISHKSPVTILNLES